MKVEEDEEREERITMVVVVDAYDSEERALGWYYYLKDKMVFPFKAKCIKTSKKTPLKTGETVRVIGMPSEEECDNDMFVEIEYNKDTLYVPLSLLKPEKAGEDTLEAIEDWHYLIERGYEF